MKRLIILTLCFMFLLATACGNNDLLDPKNPVTITLWHTYGQLMNESMGALVDEFNSTVGLERGIIVQTTYIADAAEVNEKLLMTARGDPGAPELPDIALIYPRIGITLAQHGLLVDLSTQFSESELSQYVPEFIEEGKFGGETLYLLPIAKSTEVLYLNTIMFDRFANDTGVGYHHLATPEGIQEAALLYFEWSDGKAFFYPDNLFNFSMVGFSQLGDDFLAGNRLNLESPVFQRIWDAYYPLAVRGGNAIFDNYGTLLMASGEVVCILGTSASLTFFSDMVTFADNTKEQLELSILPYPVFEGGEQVVIQRGGGFSIFKSDSRREHAAGVFLKWLTAPEQNLRFTTQTGYMPVTTEAYSGFLDSVHERVTDERLIKLYETILYMQNDYSFFIPPVFDGFEEIQRNYIQAFRRAAEISRREYLNLIETEGPDRAYEIVSRGVLEQFVADG